MAIDYAALKSEIELDPAGLGYATLGGNDVGIAALLNQPGAGSVERVFITAPELQGALDAAEYSAFSAAFIGRWQAILMATMDALPVNTGNLKQQLLAMFPNSAGTANSRANLIALQTKNGSRAEVLFGDGTAISAGDVGLARSA